MAQTLITFEDVALGMQYQEKLDAAGHASHWERGALPGNTTHAWQCVVIEADSHLKVLPQIVQQWRNRLPMPAIVACTENQVVAQRCHSLGVSVINSSMSGDVLVNIIARAYKFRCSSEMSVAMALAHLELKPAATFGDNALRIVAQLPSSDLQVVRAALQREANKYPSTTQHLQFLRHHRVLTVGDLEFLNHAEGHLSLKSLLSLGPIDVWRSARLLWGLVSVGAVALSEDPIALTPLSVNTAQLRRSLRTRRDRLARATYYDVLEVLPSAEDQEIEVAARQLAFLFHPDQFKSIDIADLAPVVEPIWTQVLKARKTLLDMVERRKYNDWLQQHLAELDTPWLAEGENPEIAKRAYSEGQSALMSGDVHRAVSLLAKAARCHPTHPIYETTLCWARYRSRASEPGVVTKERELAEQSLLGRRPFPQALMPTALLCLADGKPGLSQWYAQLALKIAPNYQQARLLLERINAG